MLASLFCIIFLILLFVGGITANAPLKGKLKIGSMAIDTTDSYYPLFGVVVDYRLHRITNKEEYLIFNVTSSQHGIRTWIDANKLRSAKKNDLRKNEFVRSDIEMQFGAFEENAPLAKYAQYLEKGPIV